MPVVAVVVWLVLVEVRTPRLFLVGGCHVDSGAIVDGTFAKHAQRAYYDVLFPADRFAYQILYEYKRSYRRFGFGYEPFSGKHGKPQMRRSTHGKATK